MPFYFELHPDYAEALYRFSSDNNISLAFGSLGVHRHPTGEAKLNNRLYLLAPSKGMVGYYDKRHLVPFGEYMPFAADIPFLRNLLQGIDFSSGTVTEPLPVPMPGQRDASDTPYRLGVLICYEAIFPSLAQERVKHGADILVNVSNDGWFRESSAPWQHLSHVAVRAVEQGRPVLRATNTGITAVFDARGRLAEHIDSLFTDATMYAEVNPCRETTLFHSLHPVPEISLAALALLSLFVYNWRRAGCRGNAPGKAHS